ncbi:Domain of unknown function DUF1805 [Caldalkalibacillus thermarum TA2.A1]|uniref:DUF1805 domain-containing protein n=1 Tax=Caldalkalibacillus thermarum (strain TA2.A1) TaxID=986075 RepID=F5L7J7_CALTT|nr:DUF1805 domain-containing protein [Caldalkalibacillus thermarum]EGL82711.1 Domain of unknown function DUF1805 [Caldalkalibacillus thermarum TA2.A1]QZT33748.1 DUF1805 domain-containing protein [Caldalkalibacillus thermarum TA2.A1]
MMSLTPITVEGHQVLAIEVKLPKTNLLVVSTSKGYIMCGALDIQLLNEKLADREIIAGRAVGVRNIEQLLEAPLESVTKAAEKLGIKAGMKGKDAIKRMI